MMTLYSKFFIMSSKGQLGTRNRQKGHEAERHYVREFKKLGFDFCITARLGSRIHDNAKIDIINLPFNIQVKAGIQKSMNPAKELLAMEEAIQASFIPKDEIHQKPKLLIHKIPIGKGKRPTDEHQIVYMTERQFEEFSRDTPLTFLFKKSYKFVKNQEYKNLVAITFKEFIDKIVTINLSTYLKDYGSNNT